MTTHNFSNDSLFNYKNASFLPLGEPYQELDDYSRSQLYRKVKHQHFGKLDSIWGTLGWLKNKKFNLLGNVTYSENGNLNSKGSTLEEIKSIWQFNPLANEEGFIVKERFINLDEVDFEFHKDYFQFDDLPKLRLTLFLNTGEGALVYYQHSDKSNHDEKDSFIEYILPQKTENFNTVRDRLNYEIPILPKKQITYTAQNIKRKLTEGTEERNTSFIIKILTFKRNEGEASKLFSEAAKPLNLLANNEKQLGLEIARIKGEEALEKGIYHLFGKEKYDLLSYQRDKQGFKSVSYSELDPSKKTLLLLHGTFSSTHGSFGRLYDQAFDKANLIDKLIDNHVFDQIIALDHPTISHGAKENAEELYNRLNSLQFDQDLDIITTSRGALVAKYIAADSKNTNMKVGKVLTFSGANGVGYFTTANYISKGLSIMKQTATAPVGKIITAAAQFSVDFFKDMPGCEIMTPKHKQLTSILEGVPRNPNTQFKAIAADWNHTLADKWYKKIASSGLDAIIKLMLGRQNDWVVGTREQRIIPKGYSKKSQKITSMHTKNFNLEYLKPLNTHLIIYNYFK